jgi:alkylhydroperoxidase/carboxymuconolactone decarboxylase family protein YurZ
MATSAKTYLWAHMNVHEKFAEQALETLHIPVSTLSYKEKALVALAISIALGYKKEDELKHL